MVVLDGFDVNFVLSVSGGVFVGTILDVEEHGSEGRPRKRPELPSVMAERILRQRIADGTYPPGTQLPPMDDLAREFGVSRGTVAAVLRRMPEVNVIRGYGSFVVADAE